MCKLETIFGGLLKLVARYQFEKAVPMIEFYDEETKKQLVFLTNNMKLAASTIAAIYKF